MTNNLSTPITELAARAFLKTLRALRSRSHNRHIIDYLPPEIREALFDGIMEKANITRQIFLEDGLSHQMRLLSLDDFELLLFLVPSDPESSDLSPEWSANFGTEGFASTLRDHYSTGADLPRYLVTITPQGNETQKSAQDLAVDKELLSLRSLADELAISHGLSPDHEDLQQIISAYLDTTLAHSWKAILKTLDKFLQAIPEDRPQEWGKSLHLLGTFFSNSSPDYLTRSPINLSRSMLSHRTGEERTPLHENAALRSFLDDAFADPTVDPQKVVEEHFDHETAQVFKEEGPDAFDKLDISQVEQSSKSASEIENNFIWNAVDVRGAHIAQTIAGDSNQKILLISADSQVQIRAPLALPFNSDREYAHLLGFNSEGKIDSLKDVVTSENDALEIEYTIPVDDDFAVYRIALSKSSGARRNFHDEFLVAVTKTNAPTIIWDRAGDLSLDHQAWLCTGNRTTIRTQSVSSETKDHRVHIDDPQLIFTEDYSPEDSDLNIHSRRHYTLSENKLPLYICWFDDAPETSDDLRYIPEELPFQGKPDLRKLTLNLFKNAISPLENKGYLSSITDISIDEEGNRQVEFQHQLRFNFVTYNEHRQEEALALVIRDPKTQHIESINGELQPKYLSEELHSHFKTFLHARTELFRALEDKIDNQGRLSLLFVDLLPLKDKIDAYYASWLDVSYEILKDGQRYGMLHQSLHQLDLLFLKDKDHELERIILLPSHPWMILALLNFQQLMTQAFRQASKYTDLTNLISHDEFNQFIPQRIIEDWYHNKTRFRAESTDPFHLAFIRQDLYKEAARLNYIERIIINKLDRYLEMHPYLKDSRRTLRIGFINAGDAQQLLKGLREWSSINRFSASSFDDFLANTPAIELLLFHHEDDEATTGSALDQFFRENMESPSEYEQDQFLLAKLRYGKRSYPTGPTTPEDYVHICFAFSLIHDEDAHTQARKLDEGWDGCFAGGLMATTLRNTHSTADAHKASERGLSIGPIDDPQRRGLATLLTLNSAEYSGQIVSDTALHWAVKLPSLESLKPLYDHSDWVVHLDRELGLDLFRDSRTAPTIIEYSDREDPQNPGYDIITVTNFAQPYIDQMGSILAHANLSPADERHEHTQEFMEKLLQDINTLSGSWALDFLMGNIARASHRARLIGNVGSALAYRWLRKAEAPTLAKRYGENMIPVYISLEEIIRAIPASNINGRYSNEQLFDSQAQKWCDDLLVLYLSPARTSDQPYPIFARIIEVKFGSSVRSKLSDGVRQIRHTSELLQNRLAGGNDALDSPFRHRQLSLLIKSQLEQALSTGLISADQFQNLNIPLLSAYLASGNYEIDYLFNHENQHFYGDLFLLSTTKESAESSPIISVENGVRILEFDKKTLRQLAFTTDTAPTQTENEIKLDTLPNLGRVGAGPGLQDRRDDSALSINSAVTEPGDSDTLPGLGYLTKDIAYSGEDSSDIAIIEEQRSTALTDEVSRAGYTLVQPLPEPSQLPSPMESKTDIFENIVELPLKKAQLTPLKQVDPDPQQLQGIIDRIIAVFNGHKIALQSPPSLHDVEYGPRLLRVYVRLSPSETINSVRNRSEDIARMVGTNTSDIHIMNVPEKQAIALDLPISEMGYTVSFEDLQDHPSFAAARRELPLGFCAGIHVTGTPHWVDLTQMPHALVAGSTGSGKTVFLRSAILTWVLNHSPQELDLRLSSSKPMDFRIFTKLPHAERYPMAESPEDALELVRNLVFEMDRRITLLSDAFCDNLTQYNEDPEISDKLPRIVAVIDEFAETILSFDDPSLRKEFESYVGRLAQKARAAGIHLVLSMQRPDSKVLQGAIKSNILHRFALKLPQNHDSRTILDESGAETLLGKGDLLYKDASSRVHRLQVPFLDSDALRDIMRSLAQIFTRKF